MAENVKSEANLTVAAASEARIVPSQYVGEARFEASVGVDALIEERG